MEDRQKGCFYGCAIGDALGLPLEFEERDVLPKVTTMIPAARWKIPAGSWSDDTSLMLCLAASLVATNGIQDNHNQLSHYNEWWENGYLAVAGVCFDIGRTTLRALSAFCSQGRLVANTILDGDQGNGSLMRIAPVPILYARDPEGAFKAAAAASETTHAHQVCKDACSLFAFVTAKAIAGATKDELLEALKSKQSAIDPILKPIANCEFLLKTRSEIESGGYVVHSLEAALWSFFTTKSFEDGAILAVNLAHDADTVGAIYGTLAGAFYGFSVIPAAWLNELQGRRMLDGVYSDLAQLVAAKQT